MNRALLLLTLTLIPSLGSAAPAQSTWSPAEDCRANIQAVTCRVAPLSKEQERDPRVQRPCLGGEDIYVQELQRVHDEMPAKIQKMFCHLRKIFIEEDFYATAYAGHYPEVYIGSDGKEMVRYKGNVLGLSKQIIFASGYSLSEWANRKEQTLFGRKMDDPLLLEIPKLDINFVGYKSNPQLIFVVLHEFGHLFDMAHGFVQYAIPADQKCQNEANFQLPECKREYAGLWPSISWLSDGSIRPEDRYFGEFQPCFYNCAPEKLLESGQAVEMYRGFLSARSFTSTYASVSPMEDFAETFAWYIGDTYLTEEDMNGKYFYAAVTLPGEDTVNLNSRRSSGRLRAKTNFMTMFDALPWKYERESITTFPLEEFLAERPPSKNSCF